MSDPSAPQRAASDPDHSAWVTANAGSGKTKVLIDRVARLLLGRGEGEGPPPDPSKILCLTYTRAAAANMQNKLFARLGGWALMDDAALRAALSDLDDTRGAEIDLRRARRLFAQALETPGGLKIQTIHAFCESLLRRFPLEAKISPHFVLMDEVKAQELLTEAKQRTIRRGLSGGNSALRDATMRIIDRVQESGIDALVKEIVQQRRAFEGTANDVIARVALALDIDEADTPEGAREDCVKRLDLSSLRELARAFESGGKHEQTIAPDCLYALAEGTADDLINALRNAFLTQKGTPRSRFPTASVKKALPWAEKFAAGVSGALLELDGRERLLEIFANSRALARFGVALLSEVRALKTQADALDFDDLIRLAGGLLTETDARDWVRYKLDGGVDHILVDEAQDTSAEQWQVVGAIAEEFFAGQGARDIHRTLFVVGDEKQSIFSFQGADPSGLSVVKKRFDFLTKEAGVPMQEPQLLHSFRSTPAVLETVDRVFASEAARNGLSGDHAAPHHVAFRTEQPGRVELWPVVTRRQAPEPQPWYVPVDEAPPDAPYLRLAEAIATRISDWIRNGTTLPARDRPIRAGDILIIVRQRNAFADAMIRALKARDIPVAGKDRMVLTEQLVVRDLMALVRFALLPDDDLTMATVLRSPVIGLSEEALFDLSHGRGGRRLWAELYTRRQEDRFAEAFAVLDDLQKQADFLRPFEFLERALNHHGARARFLGRLGVQSEDPIDELLSQALAFESTEIPSLQAFAERVDTAGFQVKREMEQGRNEVRIMTVHGAKGLEANIVFMPDMVSLPRAGGASFFVPETVAGQAPVWSRRKNDDSPGIAELRDQKRLLEMREYRRLLYVGMTRAQDWLILCGYSGRPTVHDDSWIKLALDGFGSSVPCPTPLTGDDGQPLDGAMIETAGSAREKPDPPVNEDWSLQPFDPALMLPARAEAPAGVPLAPSKLMEDDPHDPPPLPTPEDYGGLTRSSAERGNLIHGLLEQLAGVPASERAASGGSGLTTIEERAALDTVLSILDNDGFAWMFGTGSIAEVPVTGPVAALDGRTVSGKIDRLVVRRDQVAIIDFKTGPRHDPLPEPYLRQLAVYAAVMREIYPAFTITAHLLWVDACHLTTVSDHDLDGALTRTREALP